MNGTVKRYPWLLISILFVAFVLRFWGLGIIPLSITSDEANIGYDAYSLLKTGKDQWGSVMPFPTFRGFGDNRPALYTYTTIPCVAFFGLSSQCVRFPSVIFGVITVYLTYLLGIALFKKKEIGLIASAMLAINPWHIALSRVGIESGASIPFVLFGLFCFVRSLTNKQWLLFSILSFVCSIYCYTANIVTVPLFLSFLFFWKRKQLLEQNFRNITIFSFCLFIVCLLPLILSGNSAAGSRMGQVSILKDEGLMITLNEKRGACAEILPDSICRLILNKPAVIVGRFISNYIEHFSPSLLVVSGSSTQLSMLPPGGLLFVYEYIFFFIGIYALLQKKEKNAWYVIALLLFSALPDAYTGNGHVSRYALSLPLWQLIGAYGIYYIYFLLHKKIRILALVCLIMIITFSLGRKITEYITYYPIFFSRYSHYGYEELSIKLKQEKEHYDAIYVSSAVNDTKQYIFYLFFNCIDPTVFQKGDTVTKITEQNGWIRVATIDTIHFISSFLTVDMSSMLLKDDMLFVGAPNEFPKADIPITWEIRDKKGDTMFIAVKSQDLRKYFVQ